MAELANTDASLSLNFETYFDLQIRATLANGV